MSKSGKRRPCPAVGHEISSAECGEHRGSKYACPAECGFSPLAPANYGQLLELESAVDKKTADWLFTTAPDRAALEAGVQAVRRSKSGHALHAFFAHRIFFHTEPLGRTCAQRWEQAGFPGLKNDERVLFRAKTGLRVAVMEVHRILDHETIEAVDVLEAESRPFVVMDRSLASMAARFATFLCWMYPLPHFRRMHGTAILIPDLLVFDAREVVTEIVRYLGGPADEAGTRRWLAANFVRFEEALAAVGLARRRLTFEGLDAKFGKAVYELRCPFAECREALDASADVDEDTLSESEGQEGFAEARAWFADAASPVALPEGGRPLLGRVLLGQAHWRLEAMGEAKLAALRAGFEALLGERVRFTGQRLDDLAKSMMEKEPAPDPALVPPRLLENPQRIVMSSSRLDQPVRPTSKEELLAATLAAQEQAWLDHPIEMLGGASPRAAASQPAWRPTLLRMMKSRVRQCDEENLKNGTHRDLNWMLRELGLEEILFDPPPKRTRPARTPPPEFEDEADLPDDDDETLAVSMDPSLPPAPRLPDRPFTTAEVEARIRSALDLYQEVENAHEALDDAGCTLIDDVDEVTVGLVEDELFTLLIVPLVEIWHVFVPPGTRGVNLTRADLRESILRNAEALSASIRLGTPEAMDEYLADTPQPELVSLMFDQLVRTGELLPKRSRPSPEKFGILSAVLRAVIEELDRAHRGG